MNTMFTSVLEREKEIGIMKSIGSRNSDILTMFLFESGLIGLVGGFAGAIIGIGISFGVGAILKALNFNLLVININFVHVAGCLFFAFVIGMLSGAIPSYLASRKKIVDTLRDA
jgi:putative ABC transport system permease protein